MIEIAPTVCNMINPCPTKFVYTPILINIRAHTSEEGAGGGDMVIYVIL